MLQLAGQFDVLRSLSGNTTLATLLIGMVAMSYWALLSVFLWCMQRLDRGFTRAARRRAWATSVGCWITVVVVGLLGAVIALPPMDGVAERQLAVAAMVGLVDVVRIGLSVDAFSSYAFAAVLGSTWMMQLVWAVRDLLYTTYRAEPIMRTCAGLAVIGSWLYFAVVVRL